MTSGRAAGRPQKRDGTLSRERILATALPLLREHGAEAVSFRRLADGLGVTAMAIKYHVGSQQELLAALVERAFEGTRGSIQGRTPAERLRHILSMYCVRALENAKVVRCILNDTSLMSSEIIEITEEIRKNTRLLNDGDPNDVMLNLLVDYTHGFVFSAVAAAPEHNLTEEDFLRSVDWVLRTCVSES
ncbi:TetR/AcrR family transcriptional regulator [Roseibium sp. SCP14]|uniref:TetR/AcrR family transcriptional regulator n=1 Tax=Roseibium sp. SCP14 TaxID=3141375 RepID=UPI0033397BE1